MLRGLLVLGLLTGVAQAKGFGLGLAIGDPTGVAGKYMLGGSTAVDGVLGLDVLNGNRFSTHVDFLWQKPLSRPVLGYLGLGGKLEIYDHDHDHDHNRKHDHDHDDEVWLGLRAPAGLAIELRSVPLDIFLEVAAVLWIVEDTDLDLDGAIGVRYWF